MRAAEKSVIAETEVQRENRRQNEKNFRRGDQGITADGKPPLPFNEDRAKVQDSTRETVQ